MFAGWYLPEVSCGGNLHKHKDDHQADLLSLISLLIGHIHASFDYAWPSKTTVSFPMDAVHVILGPDLRLMTSWTITWINHVYISYLISSRIFTHPRSWLYQCAHPFYELDDKVEIVFASPKGGEAPLWVFKLGRDGYQSLHPVLTLRSALFPLFYASLTNINHLSRQKRPILRRSLQGWSCVQ